MKIVSNDAFVSGKSIVIQDEVGFCAAIDESVKFGSESGGNSLLCGSDGLPLGKTDFKKIPNTRGKQKHNDRKQRIIFYEADEFHIIEAGLLWMAVLSVLEFVLWWPEDDKRDKHNA